MKEPLMSGSGILWAYFELIYERNPRVFSKSGSVSMPLATLWQTVLESYQDPRYPGR